MTASNANIHRSGFTARIDLKLHRLSERGATSEEEGFQLVMAGRILYKGVTAGDSHPLHQGGSDRSKRTSTTSVTDDAESLDPRIQDELEQLNEAAEEINRLELQLDEARAWFRQVLTDSTHMLNEQAKKLGSCIDKARPYYDARIKSKEVQTFTQNAALRYDRACSQLMAAKEMVHLAEEGFFNKGQPFDPAWQEMLNHATIKVNDAEKERFESEREHRITAALYNEAEHKVKRIQKEQRRNIAKSRPYFELKAKVNQQMEEQKKHVSLLESRVNQTKHQYSATLQNLERISNEIHHQRENPAPHRSLGMRGVGVGAESPSLVDENDPPLSPPPISPSDTGYHSNLDDRSLKSPSASSYEPHPSRSQNNSSPQHNHNGVPQNAISPNQSEILCQPGDLVPGMRTVPNSSVSSNPIFVDPLSAGTVTVVMRKKRDPPRSGDTAQGTRGMTSPPGVRTCKVPAVQVSGPSASAPTSPTKPDALSDAGQDLDDTNVRTNAELFAALQNDKTKMFPIRHRLSHDDLLDVAGSDTESLTGSYASASMLDDDQIESLMLEMGDYARFLEQLDDKQAKNWKRMSLPAKLTQVERSIDLEELLSEIKDLTNQDETPVEEKSFPAPLAEEENLSVDSLDVDDSSSRTRGVENDCSNGEVTHL